MLKLRLWSICVSLASVWVVIAGCATDSLKSTSTPATDGGPGPDHPTVADPAACGCSVSGYTLTVSWSCFCQDHDCTTPRQAACPLLGQWTSGCDHQKYSISTIGGIESWVYDDTGQLVGEQLGTDDGIFACPTDPSLQGFILRSGYLLEDCQTTATTAYSPDAGTCVPTDAGLTF